MKIFLYIQERINLYADRDDKMSFDFVNALGDNLNDEHLLKHIDGLIAKAHG